MVATDTNSQLDVISVFGTPVRRGVDREDAQSIVVAWNNAHRRPNLPVLPPLPKGIPNRKRLEKERLEPYIQRFREWEDARKLVSEHSGHAQFEREAFEAAQRQRIADVVERFARHLDALEWAQRHAGINKDAEREAHMIRAGYPPTLHEIWRAWYPGAAQYVAKRLRSRGGVRVHTSGKSGAKGSIYYRLPSGLVIRISDHELPYTPEREYYRSIGKGGRWVEIVLDSILTQEEIDELVEEVDSDEQ